jgi:hypothetical protein
MSDIYNKLRYIPIVLLLIYSAVSCNIINPQEKVPTYIHVDSFQFEGGRSHDIKCVWVYYNNAPVGAFDLPATIPIITSGTGTLQLAPGILVNGRNERPLVYPFYTLDISELKEQPGKIVTITPKTRYYDSVKFTTISDFESGISKFAQWGGTTSLVVVTADTLKYEGTGTGAIFLNSSADSSIDSTATPFRIGNGAAFIEFDYKSSTPFALAMQANLGTLYSSSPTYLAGILPNDRWQKFYLNVTGFVSQYPADTYHLYIKAALQDQTSGRLLIDNIKLVTF